MESLRPMVGKCDVVISRGMCHRPSMARSSTGESVLERVVRILEVFRPDVPAATITEIADRANLPLSTASRLVDEMTRHGLLRRDTTHQIRIGMRLWELAARASPTGSLRDAAMPFMEDLHAVVGHHVQLGVREGEEVLFLERLSAPAAVINFTRIAGRLPLYASSSGLVLLAHAPAAVQNHVLASPLTIYTDRSITEPLQLRRFLAQVRRTNVACCRGFIHPDATGIAVPVRNSSKRVIAALSVIVPADGHESSRIPALHAAARGIQRAMATPVGFPNSAAASIE